MNKRAGQSTLSRDDIWQFIAEARLALGVDGKRVLIIIPDGTRSMPMPLFFELLQDEIAARASACDYLVALGTHPLMTEPQLSRLLGRSVRNGRCAGARIFNHRWDRRETFVEIGSIPGDQVSTISGGLLRDSIRVKINRLVFDYDLVLICGPVFPHEVVGFSGGNKYLFPGISTGQMIHDTHWLGALLGSYNIIGTHSTPVRDLIDLAAAKLTVPVACFVPVLKCNEVAGIYFGPAREAWQIAAQHSAAIHIEWLERPFCRVLSVLPDLYEDLWTGAKGMYKVEPALADDGEVILYAPHITEASYTHKAFIDAIGYHCSEYFLEQWERFACFPRAVIAHSTHLYGQGTYDSRSKLETGRIRVTLATGISEERCRNLNLGYLNPKDIKLDAWHGREAEGIKLIPRAGEFLYRLRASAKLSHPTVK
ncbi:MAG: DUF2088 domain-containing protein [Acidobacteria bacterium]|nr:DUF2088 domain-containing protein [Acidobacteriota bacterium]